LKLSDDYRAEDAIKQYNTISRSYQNIKQAIASGSPAGDISAIFAFMKVLDPTSVVREGEFATAQNAGSIPEKIQNIYNKAIEGTRLTDDQRSDFLKQAENFYSSARERKRLTDR